jgi:hypothetical protein
VGVVHVDLVKIITRGLKTTVGDRLTCSYSSLTAISLEAVPLTWCTLTDVLTRFIPRLRGHILESLEDPGDLWEYKCF